jgi:hypothetical protein
VGEKLPYWRAEEGAADPVAPSPVSSDQPDEFSSLCPAAPQSSALLPSVPKAVTTNPLPSRKD